MNNRTILSICIPLHNRSDVVQKEIDNLMQVNDDRFDIVIADSSDKGEGLKTNQGKRIKVYKFDPQTPAMQNWKNALDCGDGIFCFHLNDRDEIVIDKLSHFIDFLEEHEDYNGGVCKYVRINQEPIICISPEEALMNVPYFAIHTTGVVVNTKKYKRLEELDEVFTYKYGIHPHDIILGRLSDSGRLFIYTEEIWRYASHDFYKKNMSGVNLGERKRLFFYPSERLYELGCCLDELQKRKVLESTKNTKKEQMLKNYLHLATVVFFYFIENEHETMHYGIETKKYSNIQKYRYANKILNEWCRSLLINKELRRKLVIFLHYDLFVFFTAKYTAKIGNKYIRNILRKIKRTNDMKSNTILR